MHKTATTFTAIVFACGVQAQTTSTVMDMGGGMSHVDTMGPNGSMSSSNCQSVGGGMSTCNTMTMSGGTNPSPNNTAAPSGGSPFGVIGDFVAQSQERSFRKKLGQMLSNNDCEAAANFAYSKGRIETGNDIRRTCLPKPAHGSADGVTEKTTLTAIPPSTSSRGSALSTPITSANLAENLRIIADKAGAKIPTPFDSNNTIIKVVAVGNELEFTIRAEASAPPIFDGIRADAKASFCKFGPQVLSAGATFRMIYVENTGSEIGSFTIKERDCKP